MKPKNFMPKTWQLSHVKPMFRLPQDWLFLSSEIPWWRTRLVPSPWWSWPSSFRTWPWESMMWSWRLCCFLQWQKGWHHQPSTHMSYQYVIVCICSITITVYARNCTYLYIYMHIAHYIYIYNCVYVYIYMCVCVCVCVCIGYIAINWQVTLTMINCQEPISQ